MQLSKKYKFDGSAKEVYEFILGAEPEKKLKLEPIKLEDGAYKCLAQLYIGDISETDALYSIRIVLFQNIDMEPDHAYAYDWLQGRAVAEIVVKEKKPGRCIIEFLVNNQPEYWHDERGKPWYIQYRVGQQLLAVFWRDLIAKWNDQKMHNHAEPLAKAIVDEIMERQLELKANNTKDEPLTQSKHHIIDADKMLKNNTNSQVSKFDSVQENSGRTVTTGQNDLIMPQEVPDVQDRRQEVKMLYLSNELKTWQIAKRLGVSESTINRDLKVLENEGVIQRKRKRK